MPTGYIPAKKNPVTKRMLINEVSVFSEYNPRRLTSPAIKADVKNTFEAENLSVIVNTANSNVPIIKPNCTAEVNCPKAEFANPKLSVKSLIIALPANQSDVQQNCAKTIIGNMCFAVFKRAI